jgi:hypothetical protein
MPIRPELRPLYPPHWRELSSHVRFERAEGSASVVAGHTSSSSAAYRTGAGSTSKRRHGGIAEDGPPAGPTSWRHLGFGRRASCSQRRTSTAIRPAIGSKTCARSVNAATCCTIGRTIWRSAGSLTAGARQSAISSSVRTRQLGSRSVRPGVRAGDRFRASGEASLRGPDKPAAAIAHPRT